MTFVKTIDDAIAFIAVEHTKLQSKLDQTIPTVQKFEDYPKLPALFSYGLECVKNDGEYNNSSLYHKPHNCTTVEQVEKRRDSLLAICDRVLHSIEEVRQKNLVVIENNMKVRAKIEEIMSTIGIPASYRTVDTKSRARNPKYITLSAGYKQDMDRSVPVVDSVYTSLIKNINTKREQIMTWASKAIASIREIESIRQNEEKQKKQDMLVSVLKVKYKLPYDADVMDVFDGIVDSDKYLRLADAMLRSRTSFSEHYLVKSAISNFSIEQPRDAEIYDEVRHLADEWEGDGRVFRDCRWNYSALFNLVDKELLEDYNALGTYINEY